MWRTSGPGLDADSSDGAGGVWGIVVAGIGAGLTEPDALVPRPAQAVLAAARLAVRAGLVGDSDAGLRVGLSGMARCRLREQRTLVIVLFRYQRRAEHPLESRCFSSGAGRIGR